MKVTRKFLDDIMTNVVVMQDLNDRIKDKFLDVAKTKNSVTTAEAICLGSVTSALEQSLHSLSYALELLNDWRNIAANKTPEEEVVKN